MRRSLTIAILTLLGAAALAQTGLFGTASSTRNLSYEISGPLGAPIVYTLTFNGVRLEPVATNTVYRLYPETFGSGSSVAGAIPILDQDNERLVIRAHWIEVQTGRAYEATLDTSVAEDIRIVVEFLTDGEMNLFIPSDALRRGGLGRTARREDYTLVAQVCGTALPADASARPILENARAKGYGIEPSHFEGRSFPPPPANACTAR